MYRQTVAELHDALWTTAMIHLLTHRAEGVRRHDDRESRLLAGLDHDQSVALDLEQYVVEGRRAKEALRIDGEEPAGIVSRSDKTVASTAWPAKDESNRK